LQGLATSRDRGVSDRHFDYGIRLWQPADRDEVIALIIGIQRDEFVFPLPLRTSQISPTLRGSTEPEAASFGSRVTAGQWWARSPL
jgi:hypothetical protein